MNVLCLILRQNKGSWKAISPPSENPRVERNKPMLGEYLIFFFNRVEQPIVDQQLVIEHPFSGLQHWR